ncbi:benzoate 4-monooxygenase cytochrome P450 [Xylaria curta]|nr:benzoate 4-monooxygenase cytochrome P450 [Xylaria curta]
MGLASSSTTPDSLLGVCFLLLSAFLLHRRYGTTLRQVPGPFWASFGSGWQIWHAIKGDIEKAMMKLHEEHGHFVRISHEEVSCSHPDAVRAILLQPLVKGDWYKACAIPDKYHQTGMSEVDPKRKNDMKKIFAPGYLSSNVLRSEAHLDTCLDKLQAHLLRLAETHEPVNLEKWFFFWSSDSVAGLVFSGTFGFLDAARDIGNSIANARVFLLYLSITAHAYWIHDLLFGNPLLKYIGFKPKQHIMDTTERAVEARRRNPDAGQDMIEQWGLAFRKTHIPGFKEEDLVQNAASTVTAGVETTAVTLHSFVYHCAHHPEVRRKVYAEIDAAQAAGQLSSTIKASEVLHLPYLQAVLKEILRFFPPVPSAQPRKVPPGGLTIGDQTLPAGSTVSVNPLVIQHSEECYGPTARQFIPERWLGEEGKTLEKYFITFGQGYNSCPGRPIAFIQLSKAAAMLTREFEFEEANKGSEWKYLNRFGVSPTDWPVYIKKRVHKSGDAVVKG